MVLEISEQEMIYRFKDGLDKAASRAKEFMTAQESYKPTLFIDFISALKVAAGSAHQLAITQENPKFLTIRDQIERVIEVGQSLPTFNGMQAGLWFSIKGSLEGMSQIGHKMATSRAMKRSEVLKELDIRQKNIDVV